MRASPLRLNFYITFGKYWRNIYGFFGILLVKLILINTCCDI